MAEDGHQLGCHTFSPCADDYIVGIISRNPKTYAVVSIRLIASITSEISVRQDPSATMAVSLMLSAEV